MRALGILALAACASEPAAPGTLAERLAALPGVADVSVQPSLNPGYDGFVLHFTQPVDHARPDGDTFLQELSLQSRDPAAPMVYFTTGYDDYQGPYIDELADFLDGNQLSIEHRYFGTSVPANGDWSTLTIAQMAADEHAIIESFATLYTGPSLTSGHSKGGETAIFHRRFYPDDVVGTVAYVAPINFSERDDRYPAWIASLGTQACRDHIQALAIEMLQHRRAAFETRAAQDPAFTYTRVKLGPAVEAAINDLVFTFWQYHGIVFCTNVMPEVTADDDKLYTYLDSISPVSANSDQSIARFEPYYVQTDNQLGYPDDGTRYLDPYRMYSAADYTGFVDDPPAYDGGAAMHDVADWAKTASQLLLVYGGWDPWTGGALDLGGASDSFRFSVDEGIHNSNLRRLSDADRAVAFAALERWTGTTPVVSARLATPPVLHLPQRLR